MEGFSPLVGAVFLQLGWLGDRANCMQRSGLQQ